MKPQLIYYKVMTQKNRFVIERHEAKRLAYWIDRAVKDKNIILAKVVLVETGYNQYIYHYEKVYL